MIFFDRDGDIFGKGKIRALNIANMKLVFHINFPGCSPGEQIVIQRKVPIVKG